MGKIETISLDLRALKILLKDAIETNTQSVIIKTDDLRALIITLEAAVTDLRKQMIHFRTARDLLGDFIADCECECIKNDEGAVVSKCLICETQEFLTMCAKALTLQINKRPPDSAA